MDIARSSVFDDLQNHVLVENPSHKRDQDLVLAWIQLKGRPSRPIDATVVPRSGEQFLKMRQRLTEGFFEPFDRLMRDVGLSPIIVAPTLGEIAKWNRPDCGAKLVGTIIEHLDGHPTPRLVPLLVDLFANLEWEHRPVADEWDHIVAIVVPGSRTYDRAAEAYRAYRLTRGRAFIVTSGKAPYYDPSNSELELTEGEANAAYLRFLGVPADRIISERESMDTTENAEFIPLALDKILPDRREQCKILLTTSPFHLTRFRLTAECLFEEAGRPVEVFATGSRASRYWAETYFIDDLKSGYTREDTIGVVVNEYLKIAFDICAERRPTGIKPEARRDEIPASQGGPVRGATPWPEGSGDF